MSCHNVLKLQQSVQASQTSPAGCAAAGTWKLAAGQAVSLRPRTPGVLEIARGCVWLTLGGSLDDLPGAAADHVLHAGERLNVAPGQHVVMEVWSAGGGADAVAFHWEGGAAPATASTASAITRDWENGVAQPLRELVQALGQGGRALGAALADVTGAGGRCGAGLARFVWHRISPGRQRGACGVQP